MFAALRELFWWRRDTTTNLLSWQVLFTYNPAAMPVIFADTNLNDAARFCRLRPGP
jgi:hypothetical protein